MKWNSFEIDSDGGKASFMMSIGDELYIGSANEEGIIESIHELKKDKETNEFNMKGGEIWRRRSKTPLFERILLQFNDIIKFVNIDKGDQEKVLASLIDIALDLSKAEEAFLDYMDLENSAISRFEKPDSVNKQTNATIFKNPTIALKDIAESVLIRIIIAYRKFPTVVSTIRGEVFDPGKTFVKRLADLLPNGHSDRKSLDYDNNWIKELYDIRGNIEHERWKIIPFEVHRTKQETQYKVDRCKVLVTSQGEDPIILGDYLNVTLYNMITFIEEMIALTMVDKMRYPARIVALPECERQKRHNFKYIADLVPEVREKIITADKSITSSST